MEKYNKTYEAESMYFSFEQQAARTAENSFEDREGLGSKHTD